VVEGCLQVVSKPSAVRIGTAKAAFEELESKLLKEVIGAIGIANRAEQVSVGCWRITVEDLPTSLLSVMRGTLVGTP
jgi:hypothetical protein